MFAEVAGAIRRRTGKFRLASNSVARMESFGVEVGDINIAFSKSTADVAARLGLRGADSFYVALAKDLGDVLFTFDEEQQKRAKDEVETRVP